MSREFIIFKILNIFLGILAKLKSKLVLKYENFYSQIQKFQNIFFSFLESLRRDRRQLTIQPKPKGWTLDLQINENKISHNTRRYEKNALIVRRGGAITFTVG